MKKCGIFSVAMVGTLFLTTLVYFPVFADNPVNISIIEEKIDDESGDLVPWENIINAMPGMTYSAIPRVRNDSSIPVSVWMCISESAVNPAGEAIPIRSHVFETNINEHWTLDNGEVTESFDLVSRNCYKYNEVLNSNSITEPIFSEVALSTILKNEYQDATFSLYLDAFATDNLPDNPDTGVTTIKESFVEPSVAFSVLALVAIILSTIYILRNLIRKNKLNK